MDHQRFHLELCADRSAWTDEQRAAHVARPDLALRVLRTGEVLDI